MPRRACRPIGAWLGLLAVALHVSGSFLGPALYGAAAHAGAHGNAYVSQAHAHDRPDAHAPHAHHHPPETTASDAPLNPDELCIGDCPWSSVPERSLPLVSRERVLLPFDRALEWFDAQTASLPVFSAATHKRPRAPPMSA